MKRFTAFVQSHKSLVYALCLLGLIAMALVLRLYKLDKIPQGIHYDEAALSYNAWCINEYGTDGYGNPMPLYPQNLDSGQCPFATYAVALFYRLFGRSLFVLRLPMALFGTLVVLFGTLILKESFGRKVSLIGGLLMNILPYFIMHSRFMLDCNCMLMVMTVAFYLLMRGIKTKKRLLLLLSGLCYGLVLYTYGLSFGMVPIFLLLAAVYLLTVRAVRWKDAPAFVLPILLLAIPCVLFVAIGYFQWDPIEIPLFTINNITRAQAASLRLYVIPRNLKVIFRYMLLKDFLPFNAIDGYYTVYLVSIPFFFIGLAEAFVSLVTSIRKRTWSVTPLVLLWFLAVFLVGITIVDKYGPVIWRINAIFYPVLYCIVLGLRRCWLWIPRPVWRRVYAGGVAACYLALFLSFARYYYNYGSISASFGPETSFDDYSLAYEYLLDMDFRGECWRDQDTIVYYGLHDDLPPVYYASDTVCESPARLHVYLYRAGEADIRPGRAYIFRDVNAAAIGEMEASPYAGDFTEVQFETYRLYLPK